MPGRRIGHGEQAEKVRGRRIGYVHLRAVDHPVITVANGSRLDPGDIRTGVRLGHGDRTNHFPADRRHEVAFAQVVGTELVERRCRHVRVGADTHADAGIVATRHFLEEYCRVGPVEPGAAPAGIVANPEHSQLAHASVERLVDAPHLVELAGPRCEFVVDELAHGVAKACMLGGRVDLACHAGSPPSS